MQRNPKDVEPQALLKYCVFGEGTNFALPPAAELVKPKVIISTCISAGYLLSLGVTTSHFTHFIIDEAGEALETETLGTLWCCFLSVVDNFFSAFAVSQF